MEAQPPTYRIGTMPGIIRRLYLKLISSFQNLFFPGEVYIIRIYRKKRFMACILINEPYRPLSQSSIESFKSFYESSADASLHDARPD